jgi:hypothetical protein
MPITGSWRRRDALFGATDQDLFAAGRRYESLPLRHPKYCAHATEHDDRTQRDHRIHKCREVPDATSRYQQ